MDDAHSQENRKYSHACLMVWIPKLVGTFLPAKFGGTNRGDVKSLVYQEHLVRGGARNIPRVSSKRFTHSYKA